MTYHTPCKSLNLFVDYLYCKITQTHLALVHVLLSLAYLDDDIDDDDDDDDDEPHPGCSWRLYEPSMIAV